MTTITELPQTQQNSLLHTLETLLAIAEKDTERAKEIVKMMKSKKGKKK